MYFNNALQCNIPFSYVVLENGRFYLRYCDRYCKITEKSNSKMHKIYLQALHKCLCLCLAVENTGSVCD